MTAPIKESTTLAPMTASANATDRFFMRGSSFHPNSLRLLFSVPLCAHSSGIENTEVAPHLHYTNGCEVHHFGFRERPRNQDAIKEPPAYWAGALSLGRKRPRRARQWIAHFNRRRNYAYGGVGLYLGMMGRSAAGQASGS